MLPAAPLLPTLRRTRTVMLHPKNDTSHGSLGVLMARMPMPRINARTPTRPMLHASTLTVRSDRDD